MKNLARKVLSVLLCVTSIVLFMQIIGCGEKPQTAKDSTDSKGEVKVAELSSDCDWPMFGRTPEGNRIAPDGCGPKTDNLELKWESTAFPIAQSPVSFNGKLYSWSYDSKLICLSGEDGKIIWEYELNGNSTVDLPKMFITLGKLIVVSRDSVLVLNPESGTKIYELSYNDTYTTLCVYNNNILLFTDEGLFCISSSTGETLWELRAYGCAKSGIAVSDGRIYISLGGCNMYDPNPTESIYCISADTGDTLWKFDKGGFPVVNNGKVYFGAKDGSVNCLEAETGTLLWEFKSDGQITSSPCFYNNKIFIGSCNSTFYCIDGKDGKLKWEFATGLPIESSAIVCGNKVIIGSDKIYCLSAEKGERIWELAHKASFFSPIVSFGNLYIISSESNLMCFGDKSY